MPAAIQRDVGYPGRLVPFLTGVLFAFFSIVPLNLPGFAVVMPAFALMAVFHWTIYRPDLLPLSAVFVIGLLLDLLNGTPYVGLSSLVFLLARAAVMSQRKFFVNRTFTVVWLGFLVLAIGVFVLSWAIRQRRPRRADRSAAIHFPGGADRRVLSRGELHPRAHAARVFGQGLSDGE